MTENKARKAAIRWRMQQTGEPYSVAARNIDNPKLTDAPPNTLADPPADDLDQAKQDAQFAWSCAANAVLRMDQVAGSQGEITPPKVFEDYARFLFDELDGDRARLYAAGRQACIEAAEAVDAPGVWRVHLQAVELCRRAAVMPTDPAETEHQLAVWETGAGAQVTLTWATRPAVQWHCAGCGTSKRHDVRTEGEAYGWQHAATCAT